MTELTFLSELSLYNWLPTEFRKSKIALLCICASQHASVTPCFPWRGHRISQGRIYKSCSTITLKVAGLLSGWGFGDCCQIAPFNLSKTAFLRLQSIRAPWASENSPAGPTERRERDCRPRVRSIKLDVLKNIRTDFYYESQASVELTSPGALVDRPATQTLNWQIWLCWLEEWKVFLCLPTQEVAWTRRKSRRDWHPTALGRCHIYSKWGHLSSTTAPSISKNLLSQAMDRWQRVGVMQGFVGRWVWSVDRKAYYPLNILVMLNVW